MSKILVSGLINWETTLLVEGFPIEYCPVRYPFFGIGGTVSGVGYNIARALRVLGDEVNFLSLIGVDPLGDVVRKALEREGIAQDFVLSGLEKTPQSVILFEKSGRRQIHVDLKDIQEKDYPEEPFEVAADGCSILALCNINFSRKLLQKAKKRFLVATDVHVLSDLADPYNRDFLEAADILFMSDEKIPGSPEAWLERILDTFGTSVAVIGLGAKGALLAVRETGFIGRFPARITRPVLNTIGAGDALFSSFIHFYSQSRDPQEALENALFFASWKVGASGGAEGFLSENQLLALRLKGQSSCDTMQTGFPPH